MRMLVLLMAFSVLQLECYDRGPFPATPVTAQTDRPMYASGQRIALTVSNIGETQISIPNCCGSFSCYIERFEQNAWVVHQARGIPCLLKCPTHQILVPQEASKTDTLLVSPAGSYRVRVLYGPTPEDEMTRSVLSNQFTIVP